MGVQKPSLRDLHVGYMIIHIAQNVVEDIIFLYMARSSNKYYCLLLFTVNIKEIIPINRLI